MHYVSRGKNKFVLNRKKSYKLIKGYESKRKLTISEKLISTHYVEDRL